MDLVRNAGQPQPPSWQSDAGIAHQAPMTQWNGSPPPNTSSMMPRWRDAPLQAHMPPSSAYHADAADEGHDMTKSEIVPPSKPTHQRPHRRDRHHAHHSSDVVIELINMNLSSDFHSVATSMAGDQADAAGSIGSMVSPIPPIQPTSSTDPSPTPSSPTPAERSLFPIAARPRTLGQKVVQKMRQGQV